MALLETRGLGKDYGKLVAVAALDLDLEQGEIFGLLGPNGAGKTTAISMICGVVRPTRGRVTIAGHDTQRDRFAARRATGFVPQDLALYEELSARQNLRFFGALYGLAGAKLDAQIAWALGIAGLADRAREPVSRFSGGMKRRLNLVAGLLHRPRLVVLDEPTVGVDPQSRNFIFEAIRKLSTEQGMTVVYTSHYMEEVEALCQRVAIIDHGNLLAMDRIDQLVARHGGGGFEIDVRGDLSRATGASLGAEVELIEGGGRLRLSAGAAIGGLVRAIEQAGLEITALRSNQPSLEAVFLTLTGHSLRDQS